MNDLWPHQLRGIDGVLAALARGERRVLLTSPTGGGKTRIITELSARSLERSQKIILYTNRKLLVDQASRVLQEAGLDHGVRAAGYDDDRGRPFQVSSIQTEQSRVLKRGTWHLHEADLVLVDEAHLQTSPAVREILEAHVEQGGSYVGFTATPLGLASLYTELVVAGTPSELRACGALVPCLHYGPDEPDLKALKAPLGEDLSENQARKVMMTSTIWGRVYEWWCRLNPDARATILFAPDVGGSIYFAEEFHRKGVSAAHLDGSSVWVDGKLYRTSQQLRRDVLEGSRDGRIKVVCNRFVLREGVDAPWLAHGVFATVFGSLQSYLQSGGRLLRAHRSLEHVTLQDHGGNWWRHGSLNADREWRLDYTASVVAGLREQALRGKREAEPLRCEDCGRVLAGVRCFGCGWQLPPKRPRSRPVVQLDGSLRQMAGDVFRPRRISKQLNGPALWERMYWRSQRREVRREDGSTYWTGQDRTFRAAAALFASENNWGWPDPSWPLMPTNDLDWFRLVEDVPRENLTPKPEGQNLE